MRRSDCIIGLLLLALAAFYYYSTRDLPPPTPTENLGAAFFPRLLAIFLALLALLLVVGGLVPRGGAAPQGKRPALAGGEGLGEDAPTGEEISHTFLLGTMGLSTLYVILLPLAGYLILTPLFLLAVIRFLGKRSWIQNVATALLLTAALYLLFARVLGVPLPAGILSS